jgi:hypothetical protein
VPAFALANEQVDICAQYNATQRSYHVTANWVRGDELNAATHSLDYNPLSQYIVIFWAQNQASVIEMDPLFLARLYMELGAQIRRGALGRYRPTRRTSAGTNRATILGLHVHSSSHPRRDAPGRMRPVLKPQPPPADRRIIQDAASARRSLRLVDDIRHTARARHQRNFGARRRFILGARFLLQRLRFAQHGSRCS